MKVVVLHKLYNCKKLIGIFKNINGNNNNSDGAIVFIKNGKVHNETSYAFYHTEFSIKQFYYKNRSYINTNTTPKSWRKFVKNLKRQNNLKIFL